MNTIYEANSNFDFNNLSLSHPALMNGGTYFTKINCNKKSLYIETPKCLTKQGFIKNGKKMYVDLMFSNLDTEFILYMENLESTCQKLIYEKKESWFQNELELDDIETAFTSPLKVYKSGKFYLLRVNVKVNYVSNLPAVKIYNESETPLNIDDVNSNTEIISVLEIQGIKFTSKSFQIEIEMKQSMILNSDEIFDKCLIKTYTPQNRSAPGQIQAHLSNYSECLVENPLDNHVYTTENTFIMQEQSLENKNNLQLDNNLDNLDVLKKLANSIVEEEQDNTKQNSISNENNSTMSTFDSKTINNNIEEKKFQISENENSEDLQELDLDLNFDNLETITLKKPNQVYYEIYKVAREKAKKAKKEAIIAFLEVQNIKKTYLLNTDEYSDDSDSDNFDINKYIEMEK